MRMGLSKISDLCVTLSIACAFISVVLSCFDLFPLDFGYYPPRPSYFTMLAGMLFWAISGRWYFDITQHRLLFLLVALVLISGGVSTYIGASSRGSNRLLIYFSLTYVKWRVVPFLGLCWFASLFSFLPRERSIRIFSMALLCLFLPNAIHMLLEFMANAGVTSIKDVLLAINPYIRREAVSHGWWPPPYFEGRIRGLFLEPSYMINGLIPLFGFWAYAAIKNKLALIPFFLLVVLFIASHSFSSTLILLVFFGFAGIYAFRRFLFKYKRAGIWLLLALCLAVPYLWQTVKETPQYQSAEPYFANISAISCFVRETHEGKAVAMPEVDYSSPTKYSILSRLLCMRLDWDAARFFPLGVGYWQRGFYWAPLDNYYTSLGNEERIWVRDASRDPVRGVPPLSEYTATMAEAGFLGFFLLTALLGYIAVRALRYFFRTRVVYAGFMFCAYIALLADLIVIAFMSTSLGLPFAGYLYAITGDEHDTVHAPPERNLGSTSS